MQTIKYRIDETTYTTFMQTYKKGTFYEKLNQYKSTQIFLLEKKSCFEQL